MASCTSTPPARTSQRLPAGLPVAGVVWVVSLIRSPGTWSWGPVGPGRLLADGDDAVVDATRGPALLQAPPLRSDGVPRVLGRLDAALDHPEAGEGRRRGE